MRKIEITNCNNIDRGNFILEENKLNIKYAINGTGKSTISNALKSFIRMDKEKIDFLLPFRYGGVLEGNEPNLLGIEDFSSIEVFDEDYVKEYTFKSSEILENSFEIIVKNDDYVKLEDEISGLLDEISQSFVNHPELGELITVCNSFLDAFGKSKKGYSGSGAIAKGIGDGNRLEHVPKELENYSSYLQNSNNINWLKWQLEGKPYLEIKNKCPYCTIDLNAEEKERILKVSQYYDSNYIRHLSNMLEIFKQLAPYFKEDTAVKIDLISKSVTSLNDQQIDYLIEIKKQVESFLQQLIKLQSLNSRSLIGVAKVSDELESYKIDIKYYSHLDSSMTLEKVEVINEALKLVLEKAGLLQGKVNIHRNNIKTTIEKHSEEINNFLLYAGYKYKVSVEYDNQKNYHLVLKHVDNSNNIPSADKHLSYGERNAFSLVLFMYDTLRSNPDLIILDDPISSFDGNKKFAIINMLFMGKNCFKNRTVLLLTHEFGTVVDCVKNMSHKLSIRPEAFFLKTVNGVLEEKRIEKKDIKSFVDIALCAFDSNIDILNKMVYFRRLEEITSSKSYGWQLVSNIFHKRAVPIIRLGDETEREMELSEISIGTEQVRSKIEDFDYETQYNRTQDIELMCELYRNTKSNYEKLQIYRIIINENHTNDVVKKYINETFHIENDYIFQLDPRIYETIPSFIISECDYEISILEKNYNQTVDK